MLILLNKYLISHIKTLTSIKIVIILWLNIYSDLPESAILSINDPVMKNSAVKNPYKRNKRFQLHTNLGFNEKEV